MASQYLGIEAARKDLGDLVEAAQQGTDTILTRNGRAVARITAYTPDDTIRGLDLSPKALAVIWRARRNSVMTTAEFDYDVSVNFDQYMNGIGGPSSPLGAAAYEIANENQGGTAEECEARARQLFDQLQPDLIAYAQRCRERKFVGWSSAAKSRGQRIAYAD